MIVCISLNVQGLENLTMSESKTDQLKAAFLLFCKRATGSRTLPDSHKSNTDKNKISQWCGSEFICRILIGSGHLSVQTDFLKNLWSKSHYLCFFVEAFFRFTLIKSVVRSQNYVFSAPAPPLAIIPAPAPGPAIYCTLEVYCNSSTIWNMSLHPCILQTDCCKYLSKRSFRLRHRLQVSNNFGSTGSPTLP